MILALDTERVAIACVLAECGTERVAIACVLLALGTERVAIACVLAECGTERVAIGLVRDPFARGRDAFVCAQPSDIPDDLPEVQEK